MGQQNIKISQSFKTPVETIFNIHTRRVAGPGQAVRNTVMDPGYNLHLL